MSLDGRLKELINAAWKVIEKDFDEKAFLSWRKEAADCFKQILSGMPNHDAALANLGMTRLAQQRYAEAAEAYEKAVSLSPDQAQWHGNLGAACE